MTPLLLHQMELNIEKEEEDTKKNDVNLKKRKVVKRKHTKDEKEKCVEKVKCVEKNEETHVTDDKY